MNDSKTDLAAWLTQIWDEEKRSAQLSIEITERAYPADEFNVRWKWARLTEHKTSGGGGQSFEPGAPSPTEVLARIAADQKIPELHGVAWNAEVCTVCHHLTDDDLHVDNDPWPCATVRALAE